MNYGNPYYNSMPQYPYGYQAQMQRQGQMFNMPMQQNMAQPQMPMANDVPFREVKFMTSKEAEAHIVFPNSAVLLIDRQSGVAYVKYADGVGQSFMEAYNFSKIGDGSQGQNNASQEPKANEGIDLSPYITNEQLEGKNYATKSDLDKLSAKLEEINKKIGVRPNVATTTPMSTTT